MFLTVEKAKTASNSFCSHLQASSEFTEYIFKDLNYEKPYFSTYFKTTLFMSYLMGFVVYAPWRDECRRQSNRAAVLSSASTNGQYHRVQVQDHEDEILPINDEGGSESQDDGPQPGSSSEPVEAASTAAAAARGMFRTLSSPSFIPANIPESGKSSGTEESDVDGASAASSRRVGRRVRFKQVAEVTYCSTHTDVSSPYYFDRFSGRRNEPCRSHSRKPSPSEL
jgi:hypothetical protein